MVSKQRARTADLRGVNRLTIAGIAGMVDLVEAMHQQIASVPGLLAKPKRVRTSGITRLVYRSIHGVIGLVGHGLDRLLAGFVGPASPCRPNVNYWLPRSREPAASWSFCYTGCA